MKEHILRIITLYNYILLTIKKSKNRKSPESERKIWLIYYDNFNINNNNINYIMKIFYFYKYE